MLNRNKSKSVPESVNREGLVLIDGAEQRVNLDEIMVQLGVEWTVRFHQEDFLQVERIFSSNDVFTHFNLGQTIHRVGKTYALVPIVRSDKIPLVNYAQAIVVTCTKVIIETDYSAFSDKDYAHSLPNIQSKSDLEREMCKRYCLSRNLSKAEVLATPVTLTEFSC